MSALPFAERMAALPGTAVAVMLYATMDGLGTRLVQLVILLPAHKDQSWDTHKMQEEVFTYFQIPRLLPVIFHSKEAE